MYTSKIRNSGKCDNNHDLVSGFNVWDIPENFGRVGSYAKVLPIHPTMHAFTQARNMWFPHTALTQLLSAADLCIPVEHLPPAGSQFPWKHSDRSNHHTCLTPSEVVSKEVLTGTEILVGWGEGEPILDAAWSEPEWLHWDGQRCHPLFPQYPISICHKTI